jgi:molecular chaperone DnaK
MTKEAELHAADDKKRKEAVETKNQLRCRQSDQHREARSRSSGDKLAADKKAKIEDGIVATRRKRWRATIPTA